MKSAHKGGATVSDGITAMPHRCMIVLFSRKKFNLISTL